MSSLSAFVHRLLDVAGLRLAVLFGSADAGAIWMSACWVSIEASCAGLRNRIAHG